MSRSYQKYSCYSDGCPSYVRWAKRQANKKVRHIPFEKTQNGKWYRKVYCSWNIHDYKSVAYYDREVFEWIDNYYKPEKVSRQIAKAFAK